MMPPVSAITSGRTGFGSGIAHRRKNSRARRFTVKSIVLTTGEVNAVGGTGPACCFWRHALGI